jgi:cytochrome c-type biogenesis protein CcmH/NrfF
MKPSKTHLHMVANVAGEHYDFIMYWPSVNANSSSLWMVPGTIDLND